MAEEKPGGESISSDRGGRSQPGGGRRRCAAYIITVLLHISPVYTQFHFRLPKINVEALKLKEQWTLFFFGIGKTMSVFVDMYFNVGD